MTTIAREEARRGSPALSWGVILMTLAALAFIGYGVIFFIRNFTGDFLELGIGPEQVASSKDETAAFDLDLYHYISHLHLAVAGFLAATGLAVAALSGSASAAGISGRGSRQSRRRFSALQSRYPPTIRGDSTRWAISA